MIAVAVLAIIAVVAIPTYDQYTRHARLKHAQAALLENAHAMERFYAQNQSFTQDSGTWAELPITETADFCIRPQGNPKGADEDSFTLTAVAKDKNKEPRVLKIDESLSFSICDSSTLSCGSSDSYFSGNNTDQNCTTFN